MLTNGHARLYLKIFDDLLFNLGFKAKLDMVSMALTYSALMAPGSLHGIITLCFNLLLC